MLTRDYQKSKEKLSKNALKDIKIFLKKKNTKSATMLMRDI